MQYLRHQDADRNKCFLSRSSPKLWVNQVKNLRPGDFPGGTVVKNPLVNAGDMGLIPGPGRSHMPQSN